MLSLIFWKDLKTFMFSRIKFETVVFKHCRNFMFDFVKIILLSFWEGDFCLQFFVVFKEKASSYGQHNIFNISFNLFILAYCSIRYFIVL